MLLGNESFSIVSIIIAWKVFITRYDSWNKCIVVFLLVKNQETFSDSFPDTVLLKNEFQLRTSLLEFDFRSSALLNTFCEYLDIPLKCLINKRSSTSRDITFGWLQGIQFTFKIIR